MTRWLLAILAACLFYASTAGGYSGTCGIWAQKRNAFIATNYPGTQAGFDAAKTAVGTNGSIFIYGGCEGLLTIGTLQDSVFVYAYDSAKWTVYGKAGSWRDRSGQARLDVDSLGIRVTGTTITPRLGPASSAGSGGAIRIVDGVTLTTDAAAVADLPVTGGIVLNPTSSDAPIYIKRTLTDLSPTFVRMIRLNVDANPAAAQTTELYGIEGQIGVTPGNAKKFNRIEGIDISAQHQGADTVTTLVGGTFTAYMGFQADNGGVVMNGWGTRSKVSNYSASAKPLIYAYGADNRVNNNGAGKITNAYATYSRVTNTGASGLTTNAYGHYIANADTVGAGAGGITNNYGLYLENQNAGRTVNYTLFSAGGTNRFVGPVELPGGISGAVTTNGALTTAGGIVVTGDPGGAAGAIRFGSNRLTMHSGTNGFSVQNSANTITSLLVNDDGTIQTGKKVVIPDSLNVKGGVYLGGRFIPKLDGNSATLNFGVPAAVPGSVDLTINVPGAAFGNRVAVGAPITIGANYVLTGFVSAANTVTIRWTQIAGAAADPDGAGGTYTADVIQ